MRFELVTAPGQGSFVEAASLIAHFAGLDKDGAFVSTVLQPSELNDFASTLRTGGFLPVLFDEAQTVEISQPATILRYLARAGGLDGKDESAILRGELAAEAVLRFLKELNSSSDALRASKMHIRALSAILSQRAAVDNDPEAPSATGLTYGDLLAWLYLHAVVRKLGSAALEPQPQLARFYAALSGRPEIASFTEKQYGSEGAVNGTNSNSSNSVAQATSPAVKGPMCVTGASSFIGSHVVKILLERGHTVHGTVRSLSGDPSRYQHLTALPGASERLKLFEADLLTEGSFNDAIAGCTAVLHCASPFFFTVKEDPYKELIQPAVEGTRNVMRAAIAVPGVRKVVVTSSMASVYVTKKPVDHYYTEEDWSDLEYIRATKQHYAESKLLAEREAWRILKEEVPPGRAHLELATICPTQCLGPLLQPYLNQSTTAVVEHANGSKAKILNKGKGFVDVRDVALAHVLAAERSGPSASGRFILMATSIPWRTFCDVLRRTLPDAKVPTEVEEGPASYPQALTSSKRTWDLGLRYRPIEDSIRDCALSLREKGLI